MDLPFFSPRGDGTAQGRQAAACVQDHQLFFVIHTDTGGIPAEIQKFKDNCVVFDPTAEEQKDRFRAEFSDFAMTGSPVISDVKREVYGQAETAIGKFFDGTWRYQTADVT